MMNHVNMSSAACAMTFFYLKVCYELTGLFYLYLAWLFRKVGNLANDGIKLASSSTGKCSAEPEHGLEHEAKGGTIR